MMLEEDRDICEAILENQSNIGKSRIEVKGIPDIKKQITNLEGKKQRLEKDKVGDLVKYQSSLIDERNIRDNLINELKNLVDKYKDVLNDDETFEYFSNMSNDNIVIGKEEFEKVKTIIDEFSKIVSSKSNELSTSLNTKIDELKVQLKQWKSKESEIQKTIDAKKAELDSQGIPFDIGKINQIAKDLDHYKTRLRKLTETQKSIKRHPNIAVLGDAELIIPLKSTNVKTHITDRGSIDRTEIRSLCCDILEGGKQAFISRQKLYGITE